MRGAGRCVGNGGHYHHGLGGMGTKLRLLRNCDYPTKIGFLGFDWVVHHSNFALNA